MTRKYLSNLPKASPYYIKCNTEQEEEILNYTLRIKYGCNEWFDLDTKRQITKLIKRILNYSYDLTEYDDSDYFVYFLNEDDEEVELGGQEKEKFMSSPINVKDMYEYYLELFWNYTYPDEPIEQDMTSFWLDRIFDLQRLH